MKMRSVRYLTVEGIKNTWVNRLMSLASVGVLVACMVMIGLALLISENANQAIGNLEQENVVMVYMKDYNWALYGEREDTASVADDSQADETDETDEEDSDSQDKADENGIRPSDYVIHDEEEALTLCKQIEKLDNVKSVTYVSSEEGLANVKAALPESDQELFAYLDEDYGNPIQAAARVTMKDMASFDKTLNAIWKLDGVGNVQSQADLAKKITAIKHGMTVAGIWIISILVAISLVIVSNTIRITMYNRKLEISIMKAVGATDSFVRIPFIVEGVIIGIISALFSEGIVYFCYRVATEKIVSVLETNQVIRFSDMALRLLLIFIGIGVFSGVIGSVTMIRKYLRREGSDFSAI